MSSQAQNPYAVIGITADCLRGLTDDQVDALVRAALRSLEGLFHPDKNKSEDAKVRWKAIQAAKEKLEDREERDRWLKLHLRPPRTKRAEVEEELGRVKRVRDLTRTALGSTWLAYAMGRIVGRHKLFDRVGTVSVFDPPACRFRIKDVMGAQTTGRARATAGGSHRKPQRDDLLGGDECYDLELAEDGSMTLFRVRQVKFDRREQSPPSGLPPEWLFLSDKPGKSSNMWIRAQGDSGQRVHGKLIGSLVIKSEQFDLGHNWAAAGLLEGEVGAADFDAAKSGYPWDRIKPYLPYMTPIVTEGNILISVFVDEGDHVTFRVLGQVIRIHVYDLP
jgi:hypothetical protein